MKEPDAPNSPPQGEAGKDYSLDQVASVAARLLNGNSYTEAADQAILLLNACRNKLSTRQRHAEILSRAETERRQWWDKYVPTKEGKTYIMPWREALFHVTGQKDESRAQPRFKKFYGFFWQDCDATEREVLFEKADAPTKKQIDDRLAAFKKDGINSYQAGHLKAAYKEWSRFDGVARARAMARKRHAKPKKA